jgi:hypothetical protein
MEKHRKNIGFSLLNKKAFEFFKILSAVRGGGENGEGFVPEPLVASVMI